MTASFDKGFWEQHWQHGRSGGPGSMGANPPNPYLDRETSGLRPGTALDAGCGAGSEAIWLASRGWQVTGADISARALALAAERAATSGVRERVRWIEADLEDWSPDSQFDLVTTHYAHPAMPQLEFYDRIAEWVAPGGTLLIVGHLHTGDARAGHPEDEAEHGDHPSAGASVTVAAVTSRLDATQWEVVTAEEHQRTLAEDQVGDVPLNDVVVRATRRDPAGIWPATPHLPRSRQDPR